MAEDIEDVYPGATFDGNGNKKEDPIHVVIPKLIPVHMEITSFEPSGIQGLLEMFLPPYTSEDPVMRRQQTVALVSILVMHFYRLIIYNIGGCTGLILGSFESETLKSTTALIGLRMSGDPSHFLECSSSKESIEVRQTSTSLTTFLDDGNRPQVLEDILVGSYQGASKSTIARGASEKLGGFAATKNFKPRETMNPKVIEGRAILLVMERMSQASKGVSSVREHYSMKVKHTNAMSSSLLPRDYCAFLKKNFLYESQDDFETAYQNMHLAACELLAELKPGYDPRRLEALAHPIAFVMLIQRDVENNGQDNVTRLFIDAFVDRQTFLDVYVAELDKADNVIEEMSRMYGRKSSVVDEVDSEIDDADEDIDAKIDQLLDRFSGTDQLEITRFVKAFDEKNKTQVLAIAHTKLDQYDKTWSNLKFPKNLPTGFTKPFTRPDATSNSKMIGATCKIFPLKNMNLALQQRIRDMFPGLRPVGDEHDEADEMPASQDFQAIQQSQESGTLKTCTICNYQTRLDEDLGNHMSLHPKCGVCSKNFSNDKTLKIHMYKVHETFRYTSKISLNLYDVHPFRCDICCVDIPINLKIQHKSQHKTEKEFEKGLEKGRVSKTKRSEQGEKSVKKTGYIKFCAMMRPILKESQKPNPKQMMSLLGIEWRKLSKEEQQEWNKRAAEESDRETAAGSAAGSAQPTREYTLQDQETAVPELEAAVAHAQPVVRTREKPLQDQETTGPELVAAQPEVGIVKFFCPFCEVHKSNKAWLKDHIAEAHIQSDGNKGSKAGNQLNKIPVPNNQERISKCDVCGKMVNRNELDKHMTTNQSENLATLEELGEVNEVEVDEDQIEREELETEEVDEDHTDRDIVEEIETEEVLEIAATNPVVVMVKRKTLWWPAKVINEENENVTVILLNQKKTRITTTKDKIKPFSIDHSQIEGMKRDWRDAYMKAVKLINGS